jgi:hypothetical protein
MSKPMADTRADLGDSKQEISSSPPSIHKDEKPEEKFEYPSTGRLWLVMTSLYISMFLIALVSNPLPPLLSSLLTKLRTKPSFQPLSLA